MRKQRAGQALVEFTMVFPIFLLTLMTLVVLGLFVFYNQQLQNAAREAARYAAIHSTTAQCPTVSRLDPIGSNRPSSYFRCDAPEDDWPRMTERARSFVWGVAPNEVMISACWSGYVDASNNYDALAGPPNTFSDCRIDGRDPRLETGSIPCPPPPTRGSVAVPAKADGDDKASAIAFANGQQYATTVTAYACFEWTPPLSGFLFIPDTFTIRAVATEGMQRQQ